MKLSSWRATDNPPADLFGRDLEKALDKFFSELRAILNNGIRPGDNLDAQTVSVTTHATPDTEIAVAHTLKRVPTGYIVLGRDKAGLIYTGATAFSASSIYLKSNVASVTATILIL